MTKWFDPFIWLLHMFSQWTIHPIKNPDRDWKPTEWLFKLRTHIIFCYINRRTKNCFTKQDSFVETWRFEPVACRYERVVATVGVRAGRSSRLEYVRRWVSKSHTTPECLSELVVCFIVPEKKLAAHKSHTHKELKKGEKGKKENNWEERKIDKKIFKMRMEGKSATPLATTILTIQTFTFDHI